MRRALILSLIFVLTFLTLIPMFSRRSIMVWCTDKEVEGLRPVEKLYSRKTRVNVTIQVQAEPRSRFTSAAAGGAGPDIIVGAYDWLGEFLSNGLLEQINISKRDNDQFFPIAIDGFTSEGKLYGIPYCVEAHVIYYNKRLIDKVPGTWEELIKVAKTYTKGDSYGFLYGIDNDFYNNFPFIGSQGGYIFGKNRDGSFNYDDIGLGSKGAIEGAKFINRMVREGIVPSTTNVGELQARFKSGQAAMIMDGPWNLYDYRGTIGEANLGVAKLPTLNGKKSTPFFGARGFMINSQSRVKREAREFIVDFAAGYEGQMSMYKFGGRPPAHIKAFEKVAKEDPDIATIVSSARDGVAMPSTRAMAIIWDEAASMIDKFKTGEVSVEEAIRAGVDSIKARVDRGKKRF